MSNYFKEKELLEKRAAVDKEQRALLETAEKEGRDLTPEEGKQFDKMEEDFQSYTKRINRIQRMNEREKNLNESAEEKADRISHQTGVEIQGEEVKETTERQEEAYWKAMRHMLLAKDKPHDWRDKLTEKELRDFKAYHETRAQSAGTDSEGGYTVPEGFSGQLYESMKAYGGMRQACDVIQTASGNDLPWPTNDDTSNKGARLGENTQVSEQDTTFNEKTLGAYKYTSKLIRISRELLQDSAFDLPGWIEDKLAERIGRITNEEFTTGTGSSQPDGLMNAASLGQTTGGGTGGGDTTTFDRKDINELIHSVDPAYRESPAAAHMFSDQTLKDIKNLSVGSSDDRPLWQPSMRVGEPDQVAGYPYFINQDIDDSGTAGNQFWAFGDFNNYKIRDVLGVTILALQERYADYFQIGYVGFSRHDGLLLDSARVKYMRHTTT